jgi:3-oxoadipate enol-lactonase
LNADGLHVEVSGDGPAVVLVHAGVCDSRMWEPQWRSWAGSFRLVRLDLRGFGRSPLAPGSYSNGADLVAVLEGLGTPAALVGNSLGGRVALEAAVARPDLVNRLVLVAPALPGHEWSEGVRCAWEEEEAAAESGDLEAAAEACMRAWVDGPSRNPEDVDPALRRSVAEMQLRAYELQVDVEADETPLVPDLDERLGKIAAPTLVVVGESDQPDLREIAERLAREIPDARLAWIHDTAHLPSLERPAEFDALALPFLSA